MEPPPLVLKGDGILGWWEESLQSIMATSPVVSAWPIPYVDGSTTVIVHN